MKHDERGRRRTLYRSRSGMILGVCKGIAEYFDVSLKFTRIIAVLAFIFTGFWPAIALYLAAAYFMTLEPLLPLQSELEEEFYNSYSVSKTMALQRLKNQFNRLDRRIQRMESSVTDREYSWEQRFND
jgi:phage shock protein C